MKKKNMKKAIAGAMAGLLILQNPIVALADSEKVVTLGANLSEEQRQSMLNYFGVTEEEVMIVEVNNQEERKYLEGIATESQIGTRTYSCAYIMPTNEGKINVKTANLTWVSTSMIANTLVTAGIDSCDVIAAAPKEVSGTGALTGIIKAYETVTEEVLDEEKKELAMEELLDTAELGNEIGQDEASAVMNEVKTQVIKDKITDKEEIKEVIDDVAEYYDVEVSEEQASEVTDLMSNIAQQDYDYDQLKGTMGDLQDKLVDDMDNIKESFLSKTEGGKGFFASIGNFFSSIFGAIGNFFGNLFGGSDSNEASENAVTEDENSILNNTNDDALGITSSESDTITTEATPDAGAGETAASEEATEAPADNSISENANEASYSVDENSNLQEETGTQEATTAPEENEVTVPAAQEQKLFCIIKRASIF